MEECNEWPTEGDWFGKRIDWESEIEDAWLHVELPFWIAVPDGEIELKREQHTQKIRFRNSIVGVYRNGHFFRDERSLLQLTAEGMPFSPDQANQLDEAGVFGQRHYKTTLSIPVRCHQNIFLLLNSDDIRNLRDGRAYVRSLAHAAIHSINDFISAYRLASFDPFVSHVSYWDLPVWHISNSAKDLWHVSMANYTVADKLPLIHRDFGQTYRTTIEMIQRATHDAISVSLEELLDAWNCFYRGQFAEAIRKAVTSIEVAISDLLSNHPKYHHGRTAEEVDQLLRKTKFNEQLSTYLRVTERRLPGPLTHIAPEVNGVRLEEELESARNLRHQIVHESARIDYRNEGPLLRVMETMSWLHGWLRSDPNVFDPTRSALYSFNEQMRKVFVFDSVVDELGLRLLKPLEPEFEKRPLLIHDVYVNKLLGCASPKNLDSEFCVAWAFQVQLLTIIDGKQSSEWMGIHERYWYQAGKAMRPIFILDTDDVLTLTELSSIVCRVAVLNRKRLGILSPLIIVNHCAKVDHDKKLGVSCVAAGIAQLVEQLGFTVFSLTDWVANTCLLTIDPTRQIGFERLLNQEGVVSKLSDNYIHVGHVRKIYPGKGVASIQLDFGSLSIGDEVCIRDGANLFLKVIKSMEINRIPVQSAFAIVIVGIVFEDGLRDERAGAKVYLVKRLRLILNSSVSKVIQLELAQRRYTLDRLSDFPIQFTGYGKFGEDNRLG